MKYKTKRSLKKELKMLARATELLLVTVNLERNSYKARIKKLEGDVKKLRDEKRVDWNRYEDELKPRGRHRKSEHINDEPRWS